MGLALTQESGTMIDRSALKSGSQKGGDGCLGTTSRTDFGCDA